MALQCFNIRYTLEIVRVLKNLNVNIKRVKSFLPGCGKVVIFYVTEKQFANMELFYGSKSQKIMTAPQQLELF